ncbi:hypothetical protein BAUCODRAFT_38272 [Baudoinia panamericana UAMH 10762]|uniref:Uncharacterized protein n=1 Tax=Baudoinia panamericana (strain UAMH 10762) TaxID=717646 RepID=M2MZZ0_BAUPA|nr:uncharacterized protein BAUCODRAFT_38272 [Baudoinia panamericana UAMH 10762]EMC92244.1 hypothetical protein BAUCODRAFT_38272 [Baudoinia panamericana UAMH 10762]
MLDDIQLSVDDKPQESVAFDYRIHLVRPQSNTPCLALVQKALVHRRMICDLPPCSQMCACSTVAEMSSSCPAGDYGADHL